VCKRPAKRRYDRQPRIAGKVNKEGLNEIPRPWHPIIGEGLTKGEIVYPFHSVNAAHPWRLFGHLRNAFLRWCSLFLGVRCVLPSVGQITLSSLFSAAAKCVGVTYSSRPCYSPDLSPWECVLVLGVWVTVSVWKRGGGK